MMSSPTQTPGRRLPSWWPVPLILLVAILLYGQTLGVYYCSYDDFREFRRSATEDSQDWTNTFTTLHFGTFRYRPLSRLIQLWTWEIHPGSPLSSRVRNVGSHLLSIAFIFGIARLMFGSIPIAAGAALLFAVKPSANQHINGAVWPNMVSHMTLMATLYVFLRVWKGKRQVWMAGVVALLAWLTTLQYEASVTVFVTVGLYVLIDWLWRKGPKPTIAFAATFCVAAVLMMGLYAVARENARGNRLARPRLQRPAEIVKTQIALWVAITTPVDYILTSQILGEPLPPRMAVRDLRKLELVVFFGVLTFVGMLAWRAWRLFHLGRLDLPQVTFLLIAAALTFTAQSLFVHPSESYTYPASGIISILIAYLLLGEGALSPKPADARRQLVLGGALLASLILLGAAAIMVRNRELATCGSIVWNIRQAIPAARMAEGDWKVSFAPQPGEDLPVPYGLYQRRGVWAVGWNEFRSVAFDWAVQLWTLNPRARGELLTAEEMPAACAGAGPNRLCFWVRSTGETIPWQPEQDSRGPH